MRCRYSRCRSAATVRSCSSSMRETAGAPVSGSMIHSPGLLPFAVTYGICPPSVVP